MQYRSIEKLRFLYCNKSIFQRLIFMDDYLIRTVLMMQLTNFQLKLLYNENSDLHLPFY